MTADSELPVARKSDASNFPAFGPPPILKGEDAELYDLLLAQVSSGVKPSDIIEEMWVRDIVFLSWEISRWRRVKASLLEEAATYGLRVTLAPIVGLDKNSEWMDWLIETWVKQKPSAIKRVNKLLKSAGLTFDSVIARALTHKFDGIERIDHWITIAEGRRNAILREIDRRRSVFAQRLRDRMQEVEDAEFEVVDSNGIVSKTAKTEHDQRTQN